MVFCCLRCFSPDTNPRLKFSRICGSYSWREGKDKQVYAHYRNKTKSFVALRILCSILSWPSDNFWFASPSKTQSSLHFFLSAQTPDKMAQDRTESLLWMVVLEWDFSCGCRQIPKGIICNYCTDTETVTPKTWSCVCVLVYT